jgi:hypothetical protein
MASSQEPDPHTRQLEAGRVGLIAGATIAIVATVVAYAAVRSDPSGESSLGDAVVWVLFIGPLVAAPVLGPHPQDTEPGRWLGHGSRTHLDHQRP